MTLEEIVQKAIPLNMTCNIKRQQALQLREETKKRIEQWYSEQVIEKDKKKWERLGKEKIM